MQQRNIVAQHGGFANHNACAVVEHDTAAEFRARMDIHAEHFGGAVLQEIGQRFASLPPKRVVNPVRLNGMEAFEIQQRQRIGIASRVAFVTRGDVAFHGTGDVGVVLQNVQEGFVQRARVHSAAG